MIKIKALVENWKNNEYDFEAITNEYKRLHSALWAMYQNDLINIEKMQNELKKLNKAYEQFIE